MAVIQVLACDLCRTQPAQTWKVLQSGQDEWLVDLCHDCSQPLRDLRRAGRKPPAKEPGRRKTGIVKSITY